MIRDWLLAVFGGAGLAGAWSRIQEWKDHKTLKMAARTDEDVAATRSWVIIGGMAGLLGYPLLRVLELARRHPKTSVGLLVAAGWFGLASIGQAGDVASHHGPGYPADHHPLPLGPRGGVRPELVTDKLGFER